MTSLAWILLPPNPRYARPHDGGPRRSPGVYTPGAGLARTEKRPDDNVTPDDRAAFRPRLRRLCCRRNIGLRRARRAGGHHRQRQSAPRSVHRLSGHRHGACECRRRCRGLRQRLVQGRLCRLRRLDQRGLFAGPVEPAGYRVAAAGRRAAGPPPSLLSAASSASGRGAATAAAWAPAASSPARNLSAAAAPTTSASTGNAPTAPSPPRNSPAAAASATSTPAGNEPATASPAGSASAHASSAQWRWWRSRQAASWRRPAEDTKLTRRYSRLASCDSDANASPERFFVSSW